MKIVYVKFMPMKKEENTIYISKDYGVSMHLCPCGCKNEVVLPFRQIGIHNWTLKEKNGNVSFSPSISNRFKCKSHYFIRNNEVVWTGERKSDHQIRSN